MMRSFGDFGNKCAQVRVVALFNCARQHQSVAQVGGTYHVFYLSGLLKS